MSRLPRSTTRKASIARLAGAFSLIVVLVWLPIPIAQAEEGGVPADSSSEIQFKQDDAFSSGMIFRVALVTLIGLALTVLVAWLVRRAFFPGVPRLGGAESIRLIEYKRLAPRLQVYVVQIEQVRVALVQGGDSWLQIPLDDPRSGDEEQRT